MNRGNMGKQTSTAPKSKKVKKMMFGGMASDGSRQPAVMPRPGGAMGSGRPPMVVTRPGMPQAGMVTPGKPGNMGSGRPPMVMEPPGMPQAGMVTPGKPGNMGPGGMTRAAPGTFQAGMVAAAAEKMRNRQAMGMKKGGAVKGYAKGGIASRGDGCCMKGKTKGSMR